MGVGVGAIVGVAVGVAVGVGVGAIVGVGVGVTVGVGVGMAHFQWSGNFWQLNSVERRTSPLAGALIAALEPDTSNTTAIRLPMTAGLILNFKFFTPPSSVF